MTNASCSLWNQDLLLHLYLYLCFYLVHLLSVSFSVSSFLSMHGMASLAVVVVVVCGGGGGLSGIWDGGMDRRRRGSS